jgi:hypothetical protein
LAVNGVQAIKTLETPKTLVTEFAVFIHHVAVHNIFTVKHPMRIKTIFGKKNHAARIAIFIIAGMGSIIGVDVILG